MKGGHTVMRHKYRYTDDFERTFVGLGNSYSRWVERGGQPVSAPEGTPIVMRPGDFLISYSPVHHPFLEKETEPEPITGEAIAVRSVPISARRTATSEE